MDKDLHDLRSNDRNRYGLPEDSPGALVITSVSGGDCAAATATLPACDTGFTRHLQLHTRSALACACGSKCVR